MTRTAWSLSLIHISAAYGHMGREDLGVAWEKTNKADELKAALEA